MVATSYANNTYFCVAPPNTKTSDVSWLDHNHHIGMDLNSALCPHCESEIETFEHCFFFHVWELYMVGWEKVFKWWKMGSVTFWIYL